MTLPNTFFDFLPTWLGVYGLTSIMLAISALLFYKRVVYHILNSNHKLDYSNINQRIKNVIINGLGQKKVLFAPPLRAKVLFPNSISANSTKLLNGLL